LEDLIGDLLDLPYERDDLRIGFNNMEVIGKYRDIVYVRILYWSMGKRVCNINTSVVEFNRFSLSVSVALVRFRFALTYMLLYIMYTAI
jgi:hypothetical protein